jgi:uncharacterized protein (DUF1697 family)
VTDYPEHLLARRAAPPYRGEGAFALWHFSEDASLGRLTPRAAAANPEAAPLVWAVDTRHAPMFWFPRDCPRGCIWPGERTTSEDRERFFGQSAVTRIHVMESGWFERMRQCRLYAYRLPPRPFRPHEVGGYWVADEPVDALERVVVDDLAGRHAEAEIELRVTPSIWPFWRQVANSTVEFSGSRLRNAAEHFGHPLPLGFMRTWVCLLRAINLGARNKVPMPRLREVLTAAGLSDVRTYVQSGNVVVRSALAAEQVSALVHDVTADEFGVDAAVIVRDVARLRVVVTENPFAAAGADRPHLVRVIFLADEPAAEGVALLAGDARLREVSRVVGDHVYVDYADGARSNPRTAAFFERTLQVQGTERNWRSVLALHSMTADEGCR